MMIIIWNKKILINFAVLVLFFGIVIEVVVRAHFVANFYSNEMEKKSWKNKRNYKNKFFFSLIFDFTFVTTLKHKYTHTHTYKNL